jgi:hypothetical protein
MLRLHVDVSVPVAKWLVVWFVTARIKRAVIKIRRRLSRGLTAP